MIISFASGKGGTGKTTLAVNFAIYLSQFNKNHSKRIFLLDCDVEEPNAGIFIKPDITDREFVSIPVPRVDHKRCNFCGRCGEVCVYNAIAVLKNNVLIFDELCHGCGGCSLFCPVKAISEVPRKIGVVERGQSGRIKFVQGRLNIGEPMATPLIRQLKKSLGEKSEDDIIIVDVPPGTSCPVIEAIRGSDFTVLVTEPTPFGLNDLKLAVATVRKLKIPMGIVINRSSNSDSIIEDYCNTEKIPILARIRLDRNVARLYSQGMPIVNQSNQYLKVFEQLDEKILENIAPRTIINKVD